MHAFVKTTFAALALAIAASNASMAQAQCTHFAAVNIYNDTNFTIHYTLQWGNGCATEYCLEPGELYRHAWTYDYHNQNCSPTPRVRFDYDLSSCAYWKDYGLNAYAVNCWTTDPGYEYHFRASACGCWLDLYDCE